MQTAKKIKLDVFDNVIDFKLATIAKTKGKKLKINNEKKICFQTDERYFCMDTNCLDASECKKLIAAWMR